MDNFFEWLSNTALATAVRENAMLFPWIESLHVLALTVVVGSIAIVDLRLLGLASRTRPVTRLMKDVLPVTWIAFVGALLTGSILFSSQAPTYVGNVFFQVKMLLLVLVGINVLVFHTMTVRSVAQWDDAAGVPTAARVAGAASLVLWTAVVVCGRWIGFV
jgi:hypothetical protein